MRIRIATYSTKPRGGVVHALSLAEALDQRGHDVELWALSPDGERFFREPRVPVNLVPVERREDEEIEARILRYADVLAEGMRAAGPVEVNHAEDCLSARSMLALRGEGRLAHIVRTIHHVDAFTSQVLLDCQRASILDVDHCLCVSLHWAERVLEEFGVASDVVANGVDAERFAGCPWDRAEAGRRFGWGNRPVVLSVGGIEPRKGSRLLIEAFARARGRLGHGALLAIAGGETLFDYSEYRDAWWGDARRLGLEVASGPPGSVPENADVAILGTIGDDDMPALYRAADTLAFPSTREGFGLVVLEALASGIPAVVTDLPVLREYLSHGRDCVMVPAGDSGPLSDALVSAVRDQDLRARLRVGGAETVAGFTWQACAEEHERLYGRILEHAG
jgi:glycosyltransferase-like protein